jgi:nucleotide-binding universal stress UspA family protein
MFKKILVAFDLAHQAQVPHLLEAAFEILNQNQGEICLFYADPVLAQGISSQQRDKKNNKVHQDEVNQAMQTLLDSMRCHLIPKEFDAIHCQSLQGSAHEQILKHARFIKADAIVLMSKRPGFSSYFIGSNADKVVRHAKCSVFVVRH